MNLREKNKRDKLKRIKKAALSLFEEKGFDGTTTREIADRAKIATGTLFLYARDKRTLLFLIFEEEISAVITDVFTSLPDASLLDRLQHLFQGFFYLYEGYPSIARLFVRELLFLDGSVKEDSARLDEDFFRRLIAVLAQEQAKGDIHPEIDLLKLASNLFGLYGVNVVKWLKGEQPVATQGIAQLKASFALQLSGVRNKPAEVSPL